MLGRKRSVRGAPAATSAETSLISTSARKWRISASIESQARCCVMPLGQVGGDLRLQRACARARSRAAPPRSDPAAAARSQVSCRSLRSAHAARDEAQMQQSPRIIHGVIDAQRQRRLQIDREHRIVRDDFEAVGRHRELPVSNLHPKLYTVMRRVSVLFSSSNLELPHAAAAHAAAALTAEGANVVAAAVMQNRAPALESPL